jgi:hypothetical protein
MDNTVLIVALVSTIAFALYSLVAGVFSDIGHHGGGGHGGDGWHALEFISIQAILLAAMSYSWSFLYWQARAVGFPLQALAALLSGSAMVVLYVFGMRAIKRLNTPDTFKEFAPVVGMSATTYLSIPGSGEGMGQVTILDPKKGDFQINAYSESAEAIETGCLVVVTAVQQNSVTVRKV